MQCLKCGKCCEFVKLPITIGSEDLKRWLNLHNSIGVQDDHIYVFNKCTRLLSNGCCGIYDHRPQVCRDGKPGSKMCIEARARL